MADKYVCERSKKEEKYKMLHALLLIFCLFNSHSPSTLAASILFITNIANKLN